jgi:hypothetical protein
MKFINHVNVIQERQLFTTNKISAKSYILVLA